LSATLLYLKNILYWPEDDRLRSKHVAAMSPDCIYFITVLIYCCVLTVYNILYKFVNTQQDGFCQTLVSLSFKSEYNLSFIKSRLYRMLEH